MAKCLQDRVRHCSFISLYKNLLSKKIVIQIVPPKCKFYFCLQASIFSMVWCYLPLSIVFTEWFDYFPWKWIAEIWISRTNNRYLDIFSTNFQFFNDQGLKNRFLCLGFSCLWTWIKLDYSANSLSLFFLSLKHSVWLSFS